MEKRTDGTTVHRLQLRSGNDWRDLAKTTCRADGVMLAQEFTFIDPRGDLVTGKLNQSQINVGSLPTALFKLPDSVAVKDLRNGQPQ